MQHQRFETLPALCRTDSTSIKSSMATLPWLFAAKDSQADDAKIETLTLDGAAIDSGVLASLDAADADGKLPTFDMVAYTGGMMNPQLGGIGYFGRGVVLDLKGWRWVAGQVPLNYQHNRHEPIGHCVERSIANDVTASGVLSVPGEARDKVAGGARNGYRWRPSVEGTPDFEKAERVEAGTTIEVNGRRMRGPFLLLRAGIFTGIGLVTTAGDPNARATVKGALHLSSLGTESDPMTFEEFLQAAGVDHDTATETQIATLHAAYHAQHGGASTATADDDDEEGGKQTVKAGKGPTVPNRPQVPRKPARAGSHAPQIEASYDSAEDNRCRAENTKRCNAISKLCLKAGHPEIEIDGAKVDLEAHAIENDFSAKDVELEILRAGYANAPAIHSHSAEQDTTVEAITCAVLLEAGVPLDSKFFQSPEAASLGVPKQLRAGLNDEGRQRAMEAAHRYGAPNLKDIAADCLRAEGKPVPRDERQFLEAAASSGRLVEVYQATVGAGVLQGFRETTGTVEQWSGVETVDDFKEVQRFREDLAEGLAYLPPNGEAEHTTIGAKFETLSVDSYARQWEVSYNDYRNNNLGMIAKQPRKMGQAARRTEDQLGYATLMSNPTMRSTGRPLFNATDGTLLTDCALTMANADRVITAMALQNELVGDDIITLDLMAKLALVPPQLKMLAVQIFQSAMIAEDGGSGTINAIAQEGIKAMGAPRLANGVSHPKSKAFIAGSTTDWYMFAANIDVAVRVYLSGRGRVPMVRVSPLTQGKWGTHCDVRHEAGFAFLSPYGAIKCQAAA